MACDSFKKPYSTRMPILRIEDVYEIVKQEIEIIKQFKNNTQNNQNK